MNSFEQFCINLANEQLQEYFNTQIFAMEKVITVKYTVANAIYGGRNIAIIGQEEYEKEGLVGVDISYQNNRPVLELFLGRPIGMISLLDEQCRSNVSYPAISIIVIGLCWLCVCVGL